MRFTNVSKRLFDFYLFGNFHIAICATALVLTTQAIFGLHLRKELLTFVFCGTLFSYNWQRLPTAFQNSNVSDRWGRQRWGIQHRALLTGMSILAGIAFAWSFSRLYLRSQTVALVPAALSFAYAVPVIPSKRKWMELREIAGVKIFVIAITWACSCAFLPIASVHRRGMPWFSPASFLWTFVCAAFIFALTVPFDVRDLDKDSSSLKTLPAVLGVRKSIQIAMLTLITSAAVVWLIWWYTDVATTSQAFAYSGWCAIALLFLYKSSPERHEYYFSFWIDSLILLLWVMIWLSRWSISVVAAKI